MCGIIATPHYDMTRELLSAMRYRGPDGLRMTVAGHSSETLYIGFARLAIVDTDSPLAQQPHRSAKGNIYAFNGEIYNYRRLDPNAGSEVALIAAMHEAKLDLRQHLDGEYAILIHNPSTAEVTLYRDRFGCSPLYYQRKPWFAVSSEARRLWRPIEVPAFGRVRINLRTRKVRTDILRHYGATCDPLSAPQLISLLSDAVASRIDHSDTRYSLALSGGLDSTLIAWVAQKILNKPPLAALTTFFSAKSEDLRAAQDVADWLHLPFFVMHVGIEPEAEVLRIIEHMDMPKLPTAMKYRGGLRTWAVAKASPSKVVLCGDGADELIAGYPHMHAPLHSAALSPPPYAVNRRSLTSIRSMPATNLDRTNKLAAAHSKEFRSPFLQSSLSFALLSSARAKNKELFREVLRKAGAPISVTERSKHSSDELAVDSLPAFIQKG